MTAIRALIFDFDGLLVETELPIFQAWQRIYREHGHELPIDQWMNTIGTASAAFDPFEDLQHRIGSALDRANVDRLERDYYRELSALQTLLPGVQDYLRDAHHLGLKVAIASSSSRKWVEEHLERLLLGPSAWDAIVCREDAVRTKPDPALYLEALRRLRVLASEAIAFEDSINGIRAAHDAGIFSVAVPGQMTAGQDLGLASLRLSSLTEMPLRTLLAQVGQSRPDPAN